MHSITRTALVTGANRGIGLEIARGLAAMEQIRLIATARTAEDAESTAAELGGPVVGLQLDLSNPAEAEARVKGIEAEHGTVDILVNNAGIMIWGEGAEIGVNDLTRSLAVNAAAPFALIAALGPGMKDRGWGRVVNVSSGWGSFAEGLNGPLAYAVSKAALNAVTVKFAASLGPEVKVNAACPGWVRTRMGGEQAPRSPEKGAETPIWLATLPDDGPTGGFFRDKEGVGW
jgi:NAD(P)-dependent dehydrogenase (short-subunit alcohol dehydrogenase family)